MIFSNLIKLIHLVTFGLLFTFFTACSDTATDTTSSTNTTTTYTLAGDVSQISTSTTSALIDASSSTTVPDLMIMVQNQFTNDVTFTQLESDGSFEIDVETSSTTSENVFFIALVNNDPLEYVAPLVGSIDNSTDTTAYSGIVIDNDYDDIDISYNSSTSIATLDSDTSITLNQSYKISLSDGSPIGMASNGKGSASQTTTLSTTNLLDPDMDGLPNIFDAMDDLSLIHI